MDEVIRNNAQTSYNAGYAAGVNTLQPRVIDGVPFVVVPKEHELKDLEGYLARPGRRKDARVFSEPDSFARYVKAYRDPHSILFANRDRFELHAVLDYHEQGPTGAARWGKFTCGLDLPRDPDWQEWEAKDSKLLPQLEFAQFIEDRLPNILSPDGADILELAQHLEMHTDVAFKSAQRLTDGRREIRFEETTQGRVGNGAIDLPAEIVLSLPIFRWARKEQIVAKLRYRIVEGRLLLGYRLHRPFDAIDAAFKTVLEAIQVETGLQAHYAIWL